jgi:hypothetical protein
LCGIPVNLSSRLSETLDDLFRCHHSRPSQIALTPPLVCPTSPSIASSRRRTGRL